MEATIRIYSGSWANLGFRGFAQALGHNLGREVRLLPLSALPAPATVPVQRLLVERAEVCEQLNEVEAALAKPQLLDAGALNGLEFRRQALLNRRQAINRSLETVKGAPQS